MEIQKSSTLITVALLVAVGFAGGVLFQQTRPNESVAVPSQEVDFGLFWDAWNTVVEKYVDKSKLNTREMIYGAIDGMIGSIGDPYTVFLEPKDSEAFAEEISGSFGGVGIEIGKRNDTLTVIAPIKDTPAEKAGLRAGDRIIKIDDKTTVGIGVSEAVALIRGTKGTTVNLTISRDGTANSFVVALVRANIKIPAVRWKIVDDRVALIEVFTFNQNVNIEFNRAADEIRKSGADRIILDLRNNPGGLLDSAVYIAGFFQEMGKTVTIERFGNGNERIFASNGNSSEKLIKYPLVVLINKGSASASEILAGALRDNRGALIIGETSYGKGSVQEIDDLPGGSSLKVTVAKWYTPSGNTIDENGIKPDIEVTRSDDDINNNVDPQLLRALEIIKGL